jgi:hypothetical protein
MLAALAAASCSSSDRAPRAAVEARATPGRAAKSSAPAAPRSEGEATRGGADQGGQAIAADGAVQKVERKIVRSGEFNVTVRELDAPLAQLNARLRALGGFVADTSVARTPGVAPTAHIVIKVPEAGFDQAVEFLRALGEVTHERVWTEDVTDQFYDLDARIANQRRTEARLNSILDRQAGKLHEVLEVEREITRVRENLERLQGQMKLLASRIELSTITLNLGTREEHRAKKESSFGEKIADAFAGSWHALVRFITGILFVIVVIVPWLTIPAALLVLLLVMRALFTRKRKQ